MKDVLSIYIDAKIASGRSDRTIDDYRRCLTPFSDWCIDRDLSTANLTRHHIRKFVANELRSNGWGEGTVSLYVRNPSASPSVGRNEDIFIGTCKVSPRFEESNVAAAEDKSGKKNQEKNGAQGQVGADWIQVQYGTGSMRIGVNFVENRQDKLSIDDFELLKVVGKGSFGKVMQVM